MSYLDYLRQRRMENDSLGRALSAIGGGVSQYMVGQSEKRKQQQELAREQARLIQEGGASLLSQGLPEQAIPLLGQFREAVKTGYDLNLPNLPVVGSPITKEVSRPSTAFQGPMPLETKMVFNTPETLSRIRGGLMLPAEKPIESSSPLYYQSRNEWIVPPTAMTVPQRFEYQQERLDAAEENLVRGLQAQEAMQGRRLDRQQAIAMVRASRVSAGPRPRFDKVYDPTIGAYKYQELTPGMVIPLPPATAWQDSGEGYAQPVAVPRAILPPGSSVKQKPGRLVESVVNGERVYVEARPGVRPAPPRPRQQQPLDPGLRDKKFLSYLTVQDPNLYNRVYGKNSFGLAGEQDLAALNAHKQRFYNLLEESRRAAQGGIDEGQPAAPAPANETMMQRLIRMQEEESRQRNKGRGK